MCVYCKNNYERRETKTRRGQSEKNNPRKSRKKINTHFIVHTYIIIDGRLIDH